MTETKMTLMTLERWRGDDQEGMRVPHSSIIKNSMIKKVYPRISKNSAYQAYQRFAFAPTKALTCFNDADFAMKVYSIKGTDNSIKAIVGIYANDSNVVCGVLNLNESTLYFSKDHTSKQFFIAYYMIMAKAMITELMNEGKSTFMDLFQRMDFSLIDNPSYEKEFIQADQYELVGELSSALLYYAKKTRNFVRIDSAKEFCQSMPKLDIDDEVTEWMTPFRYKVFNSDYEMKIDEFIKSTKHIELLRAETYIPKAKKRKDKKFSLRSFLKKDWEMMSELEAANLPPFLQMERDRVHKKFLGNQDSLDKRTCRLIEQIYNGDLKAMSFSGPAGSGKTTTAELIAGCLHLPFQLVVGKAGVDTSVYLGYESIVAKDGSSITKWKDGPITQAVRYGAVLLFDEVNLAAPEVVGTLNTLLDDSKALVLDSGEVVKANPKFMYIESMNRGVGYCGTEDTNLSHDNRLLQVRFASMPKQKEIDILEKTTGYHDREILSILVGIEEEAKKSIQDPSSQLVSIRDLQRWITEAKYTGEWIESAVNTIITSLVLKDESLEEITQRSVLANGGIGADLLELIMDKLEGYYYD